MAAWLVWNECLLVIESDAVRREAVDCIAGLDGSRNCSLASIANSPDDRPPNENDSTRNKQCRNDESKTRIDGEASSVEWMIAAVGGNCNRRRECPKHNQYRACDEPISQRLGFVAHHLTRTRSATTTVTESELRVKYFNHQELKHEPGSR
jgi:hypothetical protein